jgi:hypothetical protein
MALIPMVGANVKAKNTSIASKDISRGSPIPSFQGLFDQGNIQGHEPLLEVHFHCETPLFELGNICLVPNNHLKLPMLGMQNLGVLLDKL